MEVGGRERETERDRETETETDRQTDRQTDRAGQRERGMNGEKYSYRERGQDTENSKVENYFTRI